MIASLPVFMALFLAILSYVLRTRKSGALVLLGGSFLQLLLACLLLYVTAYRGEILQVSFGAWPAPFGISFYVDTFSALMVWVSSLLFFVVQVYAMSSRDFTHRFWAHNMCWNTLAAGVFGAFSTNDLFNLFVWFEVLLLSSYVLFTWSFIVEGTPREDRLQGRKGLISYVVLNVLGSSIFLYGLGLLYSSTGTLNYSDVMSLEAEEVSPTIHLAGYCLAFAFAMKAGLFPLFNWLPASYPFGPIPSVALFSGLLTKIGIYALIRFFLPSSPLSSEGMLSVMMVLANLTMLLGVYGAATHQSLRTILSFHIVSQVGYIALGFAIGTTTALSAAIFYLLHHMVVKTNLFLIAGAVTHIRGTEQLKHLGGVARSNPWLAGAFAVSALSLAGLPPFSGFWAKLFVLFSAASAGAYWGLGIGIFVGLFTVFSMLKIWNESFLKPAPAGSARGAVPRPYACAILILTAWTVGLGLYPSMLTKTSDFAAAEVLNTQNYLRTLAGGTK